MNGHPITVVGRLSCSVGNVEGCQRCLVRVFVTKRVDAGQVI